MNRPVVVITGGGSGIGWATANAFARRGWFVEVADRNLAPVAASLSANSADMHGVTLDVTAESVDDAFAGVFARHGRLDALVNSAGVQQWTELATLDWNAWHSVLDVNLNGTLRCLQAAGKLMLQAGGGAIVNLSSVSAVRGVPLRTPYAASKAAVESVTRSAAVEWAHAGIRVNAVAPGYVESELVDEFVKSGRLALAPILDRIPMRRLARPAEIADAICFLCSSEASYITGHVLAVDGGFLADFGVAAPASR